MNIRIKHIGLLLFLGQTFISQTTWAWTLTADRTLYGNTNKEVSFDSFLYNSDYRNDIFYVDSQIQGVVQPDFKWPTSMSFRVGGGYRWLNQANQMRGMYFFDEAYFDLSGSFSADKKDMPYMRGFGRYNVGYEHYMHSLGITVNAYIPKSALHEKLDHQYLDSGNLEGGIYEEIMAPQMRNAGHDPEDYKKQKLQTAKDNFFYENGKRYQKYFYLEEGSYSIDVKVNYNLVQYDSVPFGGMYYFYDSYGNHIVGGGLGLEYKPKTGWSADLKYTYDTARSHYFALGVKLTTSNYHPRQWGTANQLLKPAESGLSPVLRRNKTPREVFNTYKEKLARNMGIDPTLPLEDIKSTIKSGYKRFVLKHHPDKNGNKTPDAFKDQHDDWEQLRGGYGLTNTD